MKIVCITDLHALQWHDNVLYEWKLLNLNLIISLRGHSQYMRMHHVPVDRPPFLIGLIPNWPSFLFAPIPCDPLFNHTAVKGGYFGPLTKKDLVSNFAWFLLNIFLLHVISSYYRYSSLQLCKVWRSKPNYQLYRIFVIFGHAEQEKKIVGKILSA